MVDQIAHWLALSPHQKRCWLNDSVETVVLDDMRHPAFRRFKELYEPLGLRQEERALRYRKVRHDKLIRAGHTAPVLLLQ